VKAIVQEGKCYYLLPDSAIVAPPLVTYADGSQVEILDLPGAAVIEGASIPAGARPEDLVVDAGTLTLAPDYAQRLAAAKTDRKHECDLLARAKRDAVVADYSPGEMASWPIKRAEALTYQVAGAQATDADAPLLAAEAQARQATTASVVARVLANAARLSALEAAIAGTAGRYKDQIDAAADIPAVLAVNIEMGWPV